MAKILTGPLAAGLSGKLGPVVFHQTKFGQVVQSKAKARTYTTAPAMATKQAFREAATALGGAGRPFFLNLQYVANIDHTTPAGLLIPRYSAWRRGEPFRPLLYRETGHADISGHTTTGGQRRLTGNLVVTTPPNQAFVFWYTLSSSRMIRAGTSLWNSGIGQSTLSNREVPEPFMAIVFVIDAFYPFDAPAPQGVAILGLYGSALPAL